MEEARKAESADSVIIHKYWLPGVRKKLYSAYWTSVRADLGTGSAVTCPFEVNYQDMIHQGYKKHIVRHMSRSL